MQSYLVAVSTFGLTTIVVRDLILCPDKSAETITGLAVKAYLDLSKSPTGLTATDAELVAVRRVPHAFHGEWNYRIGTRAKL